MRKRRSQFFLCLVISLCFWGEFLHLSFAHAGAVVVKGRLLQDPWEKKNRRMYISSCRTDEIFVRPLAVAYSQKLPPFVSLMVNNFFENARDWVTAVNETFQGKLKDALSDFVRVSLNTIFGVFGLGDAAGALGWSKNYQDFDLTLAHWGVPPGPYLFVPFLGPSTERGVLGSFVDFLFDPLSYFPSSWTIITLRAINDRVSLLPVDDLVRRAVLDSYILVRSTYWQRRVYLMKSDDFSDNMLSKAELNQMMLDPLQ